MMDDADSNDSDADWEGSSQASEDSALGQVNDLSTSTRKLNTNMVKIT